MTPVLQYRYSLPLFVPTASTRTLTAFAGMLVSATGVPGVGIGDLARCKLAGVKDGHPHRFRDTFAVALLRNGESLPRGPVAAGAQEHPHDGEALRPVRARVSGPDGRRDGKTGLHTPYRKPYIRFTCHSSSMKAASVMAEASGCRTHPRYKVTQAGFEARARHRPGMASARTADTV